MQTINIAICEDDPEDASILQKLIKRSGISTDVHTYDKVEFLLASLKPGSFQLVFLDVYFDGSEEDGSPDGIDAALKIREIDSEVWIAFTTSSPDYAAFGYKVKADRYIQKPLDEQEVLELLARAAAHFAEASEEIFVTVGRKRLGIRLRDIRYIEAQNRQCLLHLQNETITTYMKIDELEKMLTSPSFLRCHRSYIVNMDYVESVERDFTMRGGGLVYIAHIGQWKVRRAYRDYIVRLIRD